MWQRAENDERLTVPWEWLSLRLPDNLKDIIRMAPGSIVLLMVYFRCPNEFWLNVELKEHRVRARPVRIGPYKCGRTHRAKGGYVYHPKQHGVHSRQE